MMAYYNEIDPKAAATLRELIKRDIIAKGDVDERSILDVRPSELKGYTQCHFFAGFGVWSYALRLAGWDDSCPVWTGSCPCQPFSAAGKGAGFDDERHLWPVWEWLITNGKPRGVPVYGEQVASKDGLAWLDLVHADLEGQGNTVVAIDTCAAGFGAPHIRQRLYFMANAESVGRQYESQVAGSAGQASSAPESKQGACSVGESSILVNAEGSGWNGGCRADRENGKETEHDSESSGLAISHDSERRPDMAGWNNANGNQAGWNESDRNTEKHSQLSGLGFSDSAGWEPGQSTTSLARYVDTIVSTGGWDRPGPTNGHWRDADWLFCRDGKWRPVEPGTFPLAHGAAERVGRLRGYGNAIVAQAAAAFIEATKGILV